MTSVHFQGHYVNLVGSIPDLKNRDPGRTKPTSAWRWSSAADIAVLGQATQERSHLGRWAGSAAGQEIGKPQAMEVDKLQTMMLLQSVQLLNHDRI